MITLQFNGDMSNARRRVFERSAEKWDTVVDTSFPATDVEGDTLTGVKIDVTITDIDGPEGVLGQAGPTLLLPDSQLPAKGIMEFDSADLARLEAQGGFEDVILHEMAHVLGFGTLWSRMGLISGSGTNDPRFRGAAAVREFVLLDEKAGPLVPVANTGGAGTREGHWRELVFGDELLTGFLSGEQRPLSRMSIAAFQDMGYDVDFSQADDYVLPSFRELALMGITEAVRICDLCRMGRTEPRVIGE